MKSTCQNIKLDSVTPLRIRPHHLFDLLEKKYPNNNHFAKIPYPAKTGGSGGLRFLEAAVLIAIIKLRENTQNIFEFGTFLGATTVCFAENTPSETKIATLDIHPDELEMLGQEYETHDKTPSTDKKLREWSSEISGIVIEQSSAEIKAKINRIFHNSLTFDVKSQGFSKQVDLCFIDGGHDYKTVKNDTERSMEMLRNEHSTIVWHDYDSEIDPDVTRYINEFSENNPVFHIGDTMIAVYDKSIYRQLKETIS